MSRRVIVAVLAALVGGLLAVSAMPVGASSFAPVADTYVDVSVPTANYGTKAYVRVDNSPALRSYLRFDVQGGSSSGVLKLYAESASSAGVEVRTVASNSWGETTTTTANAPAVGALLGRTGPFSAGTWLSVDVSSAITGNGPVSFAVTTPSSTAVKLTSREGVNKPQLIAPAPSGPSPYLISKDSSGSGYQAVSQSNGTTFRGTAKAVVESAVKDLEAAGGGIVQFSAGTFDLGTEYFKFLQIADINFVGAGMDATVIKNSTDAAADTEPFNFSGAFRVGVRDLTVSAGGAPRNTSDALDFDQGNDVVVQRVKVIASRGRAIVFDGKNDSWTSLRNQVLDCVITGADSDGIELLASSNNTIRGCNISGVGGHGIQVTKASPGADQANKKANDNLVTGNVVDQAGQDGINITSSDRNQVTGNTVTNSSDDTAGRDGIRLTATDSVACDDNQVSSNRATDNQATKSQKYGLNIATSVCNRTVVGPGNDFSGNKTGPIHDLGTGTVIR